MLAAGPHGGPREGEEEDDEGTFDHIQEAHSPRGLERRQGRGGGEKGGRGG